MKSKNTFIKGSILAICLMLIAPSSIFAVTRNFTGGGDGSTWEDANNWSPVGVPTDVDDVEISTNDDVFVTLPGAEAREIDIDNNGRLTINSGADLTVDNDNPSSGGDAIEILDSGNLSILAGGTLTVDDADEDAIDLSDSANLSNAGILNINDADDEGIDMFNSSTVTNNGFLTVSGTTNDAIEMEDNATFTNNGQISTFNSGTAGIDIDNSGTNFTNAAGGMIRINGADSEGIELDDGNFYNNGTIIISGGGRTSDGIEIDPGADFYNNAGSVLKIFYPDDEGIDCDSRMVNDGEVFIKGSVDRTDDGIDVGSNDRFINNKVVTILNVGVEGIDCSGRFINNYLLNVGTGDQGEEAIEVNGRFDNNACGVINVTSASPIEVNGNDQFYNDGKITTVFQGINPLASSGTFENNGEISAPGGTFQVAPGSLSGTGTQNTGPIPAQTTLDDATCGVLPAMAVPTMGEWALIILALSLMSFATLFMGRAQMAFAGAASINMPGFNLTFDKQLFGKVLMGSLALVAVGLSLSFAFTGTITMADLFGSMIAAPVFAYLVHLVLLFGKK